MTTDKVQRNAFLTPEEYKTIPTEQLVEIFRPLIAKLGRAFGDNRFSKDVESDCILALIQCRNRFDPTKGTRFPAYANIYLRWAAKCSRMAHFSSIDMAYTNYLTGNAKGQVNPQYTAAIQHTDTGSDGGPSVVVAGTHKVAMDERYTDDNLTSVLDILNDRLTELYDTEVCVEVMDALQQVYSGDLVKLPHRIKVKIRRALAGTILSDPRVVADALKHVFTYSPFESAPEDCGERPVVDSAYHPYDHERV